MKYWIALLIGAVLGIGGCECLTCGGGKTATVYPVQGINAYKGQSVTALFETNGAPNQVQKLSDGSTVWTYYTTYLPLGMGEVISYNNTSAGITCSVKTVIKNDMVTEVQSTC